MAFPRKNPDAPAAPRKPPVVFYAPEDLTSHALEVRFTTGDNGLIKTLRSMTRYIGNYAEDAPDNKKLNVRDYDQGLIDTFLMRLAGKTFKTSEKGRLTANCGFIVVYRVTAAKHKESGEPIVRVASKTITRIDMSRRLKSGGFKRTELEKDDPDYRSIRGANKFLGEAFENAKLPEVLAKKAERKKKKAAMPQEAE